MVPAPSVVCMVVAAAASSATWMAAAAPVADFAPSDPRAPMMRSKSPCSNPGGGCITDDQQHADQKHLMRRKASVHQHSNLDEGVKWKSSSPVGLNGNDVFTVFSGNASSQYSGQGASEGLTDAEAAWEFRVEYLKPSYCSSFTWSDSLYANEYCPGSLGPSSSSSYVGNLDMTLAECKTECQNNDTCQYITFYSGTNGCDHQLCNGGGSRCRLSDECSGKADAVYQYYPTNIYRKVPSSCSECTPGSSNCWAPTSASTAKEWQMSLSSSTMNTYNRLMLHLHCKESKTANVVIESTNANVMVFKDGESFSSRRRRTTGNVRTDPYETTLGGSSHVIEVVFNPTGTGESSAQIVALDVVVGQDFEECAEKKFCLHDLGEFNNLIHNNTAQQACLAGSMSSDDNCNSWRTCMDSADTAAQGQVKALIDAAFGTAQATPPSTPSPTPSRRRRRRRRRQRGSSLIDVGVDVAGCKDPRIEPPEEWVCDCKQPWLAVCNVSSTEINSTCLQNYWCTNHSSIMCQSWKDHVGCTSSSSALGQLAVVDSGASAVSLLEQMERRSWRDRANKAQQGRDLEESVTGKELC